jgi:hypothetical protein
MRLTAHERYIASVRVSISGFRSRAGVRERWRVRRPSACCDAHLESGLGHSRHGGASCRFSHVRNAPFASVDPKKAACRDGPIPTVIAAQQFPALFYSITSSAAYCSVSGMVRPSALAARRLMTSSNLVGNCTGRSAGFPPLRMRSMYSAPLAYCSNTSGP